MYENHDRTTKEHSVSNLIGAAESEATSLIQTRDRSNDHEAKRKRALTVVEISGDFTYPNQ